MPVCELCSSHEAVGYFWIKNSHILNEGVKVCKWLCKDCVAHLKAYDVRLEVAPAFPIQPRDVKG